MKKVYLLKYYYNNYDQLDGYVEGVFEGMPDFHKLKKFFEETGTHTPHEAGKDRDACLGMLSRGEEVREYGARGGDSWRIVEKDLY